MSTIRNIAVAAACMLAAVASAEEREVVQIKYLDGVTDYIPASEISRISIKQSVDAQSQALADVDAALHFLKEVNNYDSSHSGFGYPSLMISLDVRTEDMVTAFNGYDHFTNWANFRTSNKLMVNAKMWQTMYGTILKANKVIAGTAADSDENRLLLAQAYGLRSWAYWNIVQTYAPNPALNPGARGIPLVNTALKTDTIGHPNSTADEVYASILADINMAIELSDGDIAPAHLNIAKAKRYIDHSVAYGLRARYNLTMHRYAEAAADARRAIELTSARPLDPVAAAFPGFNDAKLGNWMWAIIVDPDDTTAQSILNFTGHLSALSASGYASMGVAKSCGLALHNYLAAHPADVRNGWFTDSDGRSANLTRQQQDVVQRNFQAGAGRPWISIKFDNYRSALYTTTHASDIPLMRVEEMYLIEAEGMAMSGRTAEAAELLNTFVRTYRDADYSYTSTTAGDLRNEILWQRRAELWGEGLVYFDKLRLQLGIDRWDDANFPASYQYRISGTSPFMLYLYPKTWPIIAGWDYEDATQSYPTPGPSWNE